MTFDKRPGNGALYRIDGCQVSRVVGGLTIANGPALDEYHGRLYLADTGIGVVDVFDLDPVTGAISSSPAPP